MITGSCFSQSDTLNANSLKPLKKNSPNYFCERSINKIIIKEGYKIEDKLNGEIRFYEQGKLVNVFTYKDDLPNGSYAAYYFPGGNIYITGAFKDGKKEGVWKEYDTKGKLSIVKKYHNDEQIE